VCSRDATGFLDRSGGTAAQPEVTAELQCLGGSAAGLLPYPDGPASQAATPIAVVRQHRLAHM